MQIVSTGHNSHEKNNMSTCRLLKILPRVLSLNRNMKRYFSFLHVLVVAKRCNLLITNSQDYSNDYTIYTVVNLWIACFVTVSEG